MLQANLITEEDFGFKCICVSKPYIVNVQFFLNLLRGFVGNIWIFNLMDNFLFFPWFEVYVDVFIR